MPCPIFPSMYLCVLLSISLSGCLSIYVYLPVSVSQFLSLAVTIPVSVFICLSFSLCMCMSVSICVCVCVSAAFLVPFFPLSLLPPHSPSFSSVLLNLSLSSFPSPLVQFLSSFTVSFGSSSCGPLPGLLPGPCRLHVMVLFWSSSLCYDGLFVVFIRVFAHRRRRLPLLRRCLRCSSVDGK